MKKIAIKKTINNKNKGYYIPLMNKNKMVSSITPFYSGDLKKGFNNYALKPATEMDLYDLTDKRNVMFFINGVRYDLNGQQIIQANDNVEVVYEQLNQKVKRTNEIYEINTESFMMVDKDFEFHNVKFKNISKEKIKLKIVTSIPLYSRSPENIFDHRHVTSLLNRVKIIKDGIINIPTLIFDEEGHKVNQVTYSVVSKSENLKVSHIIPTIDDYLNGGSMLNPLGLENKSYKKGDLVSGYEAIGAISYKEIEINQGEEIEFNLFIGIHDNEKKFISEYNTLEFFDIEEERTKVEKYYEELTGYINFNVESEERSNQLKWIALQPVLRRMLGNSYLPHHDYGKGGRGWRDLWQDLLALIYSSDKTVKESIVFNYAGVRIDGSNATIIGDEVGEFKADRNKITRVWSDHGAWPLLTTKLYIDETGDLSILLEKQNYFDDQFTHYTKGLKEDYSDDNKLKVGNKEYKNTILEHIILQNIVGILNVGEKGFTKLEDADWNDGLDMASEKGETISFTMFYINNLYVISDLLKQIKDEKISIFESLWKLINDEINLLEYFDLVAKKVGLNQIMVDKARIIEKLISKANNMKKHVLNKALINDMYFQGYVNNDGVFLDDENTITLTAQAMALLNDIPNEKLSERIAKVTKEKLYDKNVGGYKLNSNYNSVMTNMGRAYGFAYGHKENGAVFCHMATMYAYGLYNYNLIEYGSEAIRTLLDKALDEESNVIAGVPEYFTNKGVGKYMFLTGTASWMIKLYREQIFGIVFKYGKLRFKPKLTRKDFNNGCATITTYIYGELRKVTYINKKGLDYGEYTIKEIKVGDVKYPSNSEFEKINGDVEVVLDEYN